MPLISIITAAQGDRGPLLAEAGASVAAQRLPPGWELEWVVQEDGPDPSLADVVPTARYEANREQLGVAATRNFALTRARGELIQVLDSDDLLLPDATATMIGLLADARVHWATAQALDLHPDGTRVEFPYELPAHHVRPGALWAFKAEYDRIPVHCASLVARTATVRALGGWTGIPFAEDVGLLMALSELTEGRVTESATWLYRKHPGNMTARPAVPEQVLAAERLIRQRVAAVRALGLSLAPP